MTDSLEINNATELYNLVKDSEELKQEPEVKDIISIIEGLDKACPCHRTGLRDKAQGILFRMLPLIQARNVKYFELLKIKAQTKNIIFKDGPLVLLSV